MDETGNIIHIDESLCTGCGRCIIACAQGAIAIVDGKARLTEANVCDGLGACIGQCPSGALTLVKREGRWLDENTGSAGAAPCCASRPVVLPGGPGRDKDAPSGEPASLLAHWPVKLALLGAGAPFLADADLVLLGDCCGVAIAGLHERILHRRAVAIACPKFDDKAAHTARLAEILAVSRPRSLTVVHMEVPCCSGLHRIAVEAARLSGTGIPVGRLVVSRKGEILADADIPLAPPGQHRV